MRYKQYNNTDLKTSVVGIGTWPMSNIFWGKTEEKDCLATLNEALDCGINLIDTAPCYGDGRTEKLIAQVMKGRNREDVVISTKCGLYRNMGYEFCNDLRPIAVRKEIEGSLKRLNTDYIDVYFIHKPDPETPLEVTFKVLTELKAEGKFKYLGVSNFDFDLLEKAAMLHTNEPDVYARVDFIQPRYSLLSRESEFMNKAAKYHGIGVMSFGSLDGGILTGKFKEPPKFNADDMRGNFYHYFTEPNFSKCKALLEVLEQIAQAHDAPVGQVAINWVAQQDFISTTLVGAKTPAQIRQNAEAGNWELTQAEMTAIDDAYARIFGAVDSDYTHGCKRK